MSFFTNLINHNPSTKKIFADLLDDYNKTYDNAINCFKPINNVYYHFFYSIQTSVPPLDVKIEDLQASMTALSSLIKQLYDKKTEINDLYHNNQKALNKFKSQVIKVNSTLVNVYEEISQLYKAIRLIPNFAKYNELKFIVRTNDNMGHIFHKIPKDIQLAELE